MASVIIKGDIPGFMGSIEQMQIVLKYLSTEQVTFVFSLVKPVLFVKVNEMISHQICPNDVVFHQYMSDAQERISRVNTPEGFFALKNELATLLPSISSPQVRAVKDQIRSLQSNAGFFNKKRSKAESIEHALCNIPLASRGNVISEASNPVQEALARHRRTGILYRTPSGEIDLAKSTSRFRELKSQFASEPQEPRGVSGPSRL